jgi:L-alanine-DL-glutamate epimerase-like enolase superfamily enzyme
VEYLYVNLEASVFQKAPKFEKGYIDVPQGPGLGLEVDPAVIQHYSRPL